MTSLRLPPTFIPGTPSSQPPITCPFPITTLKLVRPGWRLESNWWPSVSQPVYCTSALSPDLATSPVPTLRSITRSPSGYVTHGGSAVREHDWTPPPALKSSAPGAALGEAAGPGLSLATPGVPAYGAAQPPSAAPNAVRGRRA